MVVQVNSKCSKSREVWSGCYIIVECGSTLRRDDMQGRSKRILGGRAHSIFIPTLQCNVQYLNLLSITRAYYIVIEQII